MLTVGKATVFVDPPRPELYRDALFESTDPSLNGDNQLLPFRALQAHLMGLGYEVHTADYLMEGEFLGETNYYYSMGPMRSYEGLLERADVRLQGFFVFEPPALAPELYAALPQLSECFEAVYVHNVEGDGYSLAGVDQSKLRKLHQPQTHGLLNGLWSRPGRSRRLVMVGPSGGQLYPDQLRAAEPFAASGDVDIYSDGLTAQEADDSPLIGSYKGPARHKLETLSCYTFSLCFESMRMKGYVTELIFDSLAVGTVPVYLGAPDIQRYVPGNCFIDASNFTTYSDLREFLAGLHDSDIALYREGGAAFLRSGVPPAFGRDGLCREFDLPRVGPARADPLGIAYPAVHESQAEAPEGAPLLSIAIPTWNRSPFLRELLSTIKYQFDAKPDLKQLVDLYVADNASTDGTANTVRDSGLPIRYARHPINIGGMRNIHHAYATARGHYVWVIGDDELLPPDSIGVIVGLLERYRPSLVIARAPAYPAFFRLPQAFESYDEMCKFAEVHNPHFLLAHTHLSLNILRRDCFDSKLAACMLPTYYAQLYGIAWGLREKPGPVILPVEETIYVRSERAPTPGAYSEEFAADRMRYAGWLFQQYGVRLDPHSLIGDYCERVRQLVTELLNTYELPRWGPYPEGWI